MPMQPRYQLPVAAAASLAMAACSPTFFHTPRLLHPGTAPYQRYKAEQYDPYPPNDVAPKIVGGRPLDYAIPANEVTRSREYLDETRTKAQPVFVPTPATSFPPVITTPPGYAPAPIIVPQPSASAAPPIKYRY